MMNEEPSSTKILGARGESLAEKFLQSNGYRIIEKNWRCRIGELDLIASKNRTLYFVEVKTRHNARFGSPVLAVNATKQRKIRRLAELYVATRPGCASYREMCFACLGICLDEDPPRFEWLPNAFGM